MDRRVSLSPLFCGRMGRRRAHPVCGENRKTEGHPLACRARGFWSLFPSRLIYGASKLHRPCAHRPGLKSLFRRNKEEEIERRKEEMRTSCNGCRVLRKGCNDNCSIRPCLAWLKTPVAQANATVFLAKFYGRAGLINLLSSAPVQLRPAVFRSLLYEACGRIVNPIHGSVGLLWSGGWQHCLAAVDAVLTGEPIPKVSAGFGGGGGSGEAVKAGDIRHLSKEAAAGHYRAVKPRSRFKRSGARRVREVEARGMSMEMPEMMSSGKGREEVEDDSFGVDLELTLGFK